MQPKKGHDQQHWQPRGQGEGGTGTVLTWEEPPRGILPELRTQLTGTKMFFLKARISLNFFCANSPLHPHPMIPAGPGRGQEDRKDISSFLWSSPGD
jgi:hypothetical protein